MAPLPAVGWGFRAFPVVSVGLGRPREVIAVPGGRLAPLPASVAFWGKQPSSGLLGCLSPRQHGSLHHERLDMLFNQAPESALGAIAGTAGPGHQGLVRPLGLRGPEASALRGAGRRGPLGGPCHAGESEVSRLGGLLGGSAPKVSVRGAEETYQKPMEILGLLPREAWLYKGPNSGPTGIIFIRHPLGVLGTRSRSSRLRGVLLARGVHRRAAPRQVLICHVAGLCLQEWSKDEWAMSNCDASARGRARGGSSSPCKARSSWERMRCLRWPQRCVRALSVLGWPLLQRHRASEKPCWCQQLLPLAKQVLAVLGRLLNPRGFRFGWSTRKAWTLRVRFRKRSRAM